MDPRTRVLLEAPIDSTLLRLATPNMLAGGAWFGSLTWPWSTVGGSHAAAP
jgi:hypothetical protein